MNKLLQEGLCQISETDTNSILQALEKYINEIELWNPRYGLVKASGDDLIIKHILDSLSPLAHIREENPETLADIGSGAGLPGIPLSLFLPEIQFSLIERSGKRVRFLENTTVILSLKNVTIINQDFNLIQKKYDLITFRAFSALTINLLESLETKLTTSGKVFAYKGRKEQWISEAKTAESRNWKVEALKLDVPFLRDERYLLKLSKPA